jgi:uncharacterized protein
MTNKQVIQKTTEFVKETFRGREAAHDWWHIARVHKVALAIAQEEKANTYVVELAALLHDAWDHKYYNGDSSVGPHEAGKWLSNCQVDPKDIAHVQHIIANMSYNQSFSADRQELTLEGKIVQDADRLDALGAIGIARTFAYGGAKGRLLYDPEKAPQKFSSPEEYKKGDSSSINHFYEKLLLLKDLMNTATAKQIAQELHEFMELFLDRFHKEWEGKSY